MEIDVAPDRLPIVGMTRMESYGYEFFVQTGSPHGPWQAVVRGIDRMDPLRVRPAAGSSLVVDDIVSSASDGSDRVLVARHRVAEHGSVLIVPLDSLNTRHSAFQDQDGRQVLVPGDHRVLISEVAGGAAEQSRLPAPDLRTLAPPRDHWHDRYGRTIAAARTPLKISFVQSSPDDPFRVFADRLEVSGGRYASVSRGPAPVPHSVLDLESCLLEVGGADWSLYHLAACLVEGDRTTVLEHPQFGTGASIYIEGSTARIGPPYLRGSETYPLVDRLGPGRRLVVTGRRDPIGWDEGNIRVRRGNLIL